MAQEWEDSYLISTTNSKLNKCSRTAQLKKLYNIFSLKWLWKKIPDVSWY